MANTVLKPKNSRAKSRVLLLEDEIIQQALTVLDRRMFERGPSLEQPQHVRQYLRLKLAGETREVFAVIFLDTRHRVIAFEHLFLGTIDTVSVHPRPIMQRALELNSAAIMVVHNHPSGDTTPSQHDKSLTNTLKDSLLKIDVRLLDHFIIGKGEPFSFAEAGLI